MSQDKKQNYFDDTIVIDNILSDNDEDLITIYSKDLHSQYLDKNTSYKVSPDGKILRSNLMGEVFEDSKESLTKELVDYGFEKIPDNFSEQQLKGILKFSTMNILKDITCAKIEPFSVAIDEDGDLKVMLVAYNGNSITLNIGKFPLKLKDANNKIVVADFVDLNLEVSTKKIGICQVKLNKEIFKEQVIDLSNWTITFEV